MNNKLIWLKTNLMRKKVLTIYLLGAIFCFFVYIKSKETVIDWECLQRTRLEKTHHGRVTEDRGKNFTIAFADKAPNFEWLVLPPTPSDCNATVFVVVGSRPDSFGLRMAIRDTWAHPKLSAAVGNGRLRMAFLIGNDKNDKVMNVIREEAKMFGDVVLVDSPDTYANLPYKTLTSFLYAVKVCPSVPLVVKLDEDVVLMPDMLLDLVDSGHITTDEKTSKIYGYPVNAGVRPIRNDQHRWYTSFRQYECPSFPMYVSGPFYILTKKAVADILWASQFRRIITIEDVFITGLLAYDVGAQHDVLENIFYYYELTTATTKSPLLAWHGVKDPQEFRDAHIFALEHRCRPCKFQL